MRLLNGRQLRDVPVEARSLGIGVRLDRQTRSMEIIVQLPPRRASWRCA